MSTPDTQPAVTSAPGPVSIAACPGYELDEVRSALRSLLEPLGGMAAFVSPGERIGLKVNLLMATTPEAAITTHPVFVEAVAAEVSACGATPFIVDSPGAGIPNTEGALRRVYRKSGMLELAERTGIELNWDTTVESVSHPGASLVKRLDVLAPVLRADGIISLPKLKTHYFMTFTGAVKNLFGVIPGFAKPGYHAKLADPGRFADMLLDILTYVRPRLSLMDGIVALEGEGPGTGGRPREVGVMLGSADAVALDAAACRLVGIDPARVATLVRAQERGMWGGPTASLQLTGPAADRSALRDFVVPAGSPRDPAGLGPGARFSWAALPILRSAFSPRPRPKSGRCTACRTCERACPVSAITVADGLARVDDDLCIRCYCCHELCPDAAIDLETGRLGRTLRTVGIR